MSKQTAIEQDGTIVETLPNADLTKGRISFRYK